MRFNKQELIAIASQPSQKFDREGILIVKEKQDGFFRRAESLKAVPVANAVKDGKRERLRSLSCVGVSGKVSLERWFRLHGNLLFYLRGPEQWSEPMGVIVLELCTIRTEAQDEWGHWPFQIVWEGGLCHKMAAVLESERTGWLQAIELASYESIKSRILVLQERLEKKMGTDLDIDIHMWRLQKGLTMDINEVPLCELSLSCDNLLCDAHGRPPSPLIVVHVKSPTQNWIRYAATEVIEESSNPSFSRTISFRASDGLNNETMVRMTVYNMREYVTQTAVPMGHSILLLSTIQDTQRLRIALSTFENKTVGFVTLNCWSLEPCNLGASPKHNKETSMIKVPQKLLSHRRSHSLPPRLGVKLKLPSHGNMFKQNFANIFQVTYIFHSGLNGDITVHEIMAESKLCYQLPIQLLGIFIQREKELLQEVICMGELGGPWKSRQMGLLDIHLSLLKHYSHARQSMQTLSQTSNGKYFKPSCRKDESSLEFAPVNLHLQRMWVHNDTLNKSGFHDLITVGAFTAHTHKAGAGGGLLRLVQQMKETNSSKIVVDSPSASRVQMACDAVQAIKQLRGEIVNIMRKLLALAKMKQSAGMMLLAEEMIVKTRTLLTLWDSGLVEESLAFIDAHKVPQTTSAKVLVGMNVAVRPKVLSPFKQLTEQLSMFDLKSPELEDFATPCTPNLDRNVWTSELAKLSSSVPNVNNMEQASFDTNKSNKPNCWTNAEKGPNELQFYNDHFNSEAIAYANLNHFHSLNFHKDDNDHSESSPINQPTQNCDATNTEHSVKSSLASSGPESTSNEEKKSLPISATPSASHLHSSDRDSLVFQMSLEDIENMDFPVEDTHQNLMTNGDKDSYETIANNDPIVKQFLDVTSMTNSPSANYYQPSDEPEPWDLTQLNIEASVMCLVSKVKFFCGRCGSPAVRLRNKQTSQPLQMDRSFLKSKSLTKLNKRDTIQTTAVNEVRCSQPKAADDSRPGLVKGGTEQHKYMTTAAEADDALVQAVDKVQNVVKKGNKFTDGLKLSEVPEWASELRPPMRKLRQAMDGLLKSGRLAHAVLRLRYEPPQRTPAHAALQIRRDTCFSQALTAVTTGLMCWLWSTKQEIVVQLLEAGLGPLCGFEGLLSLYRTEKAMWGDMVVAIEDLQTVLFTLTRSNQSTSTTPMVTGSRCSLNVQLPVPDSLYVRFQSKKNHSFTITAVFFNIGINEKATVAEAFGDTAPQEQSNTDNFDRLNQYYHKYKKVFPTNCTGGTRASSRTKPLEEIMEHLRIIVRKKTFRNIEVLHLAAQATRLMNGVRVTSCKSAKDRTGMSCTLEQCTILASEYHLAEHEFSKALDCMRSEGCRRENTLKNTGVRKYAFNKLQVMALPTNYRPPAGTYGSTQT